MQVINQSKGIKQGSDELISSWITCLFGLSNSSTSWQPWPPDMPAQLSWGPCRWRRTWPWKQWRLFSRWAARWSSPLGWGTATGRTAPVEASGSHRRWRTEHTWRTNQWKLQSCHLRPNTMYAARIWRQKCHRCCLFVCFYMNPPSKSSLNTRLKA